MAVIGTDIEEAKRILMMGNTVAIPTETVYGLAGNGFDEHAINEIFRIKGRPQSNPLILHIAGIDQLPLLSGRVPAVARTLAERFWPGPLTLLLPKNKSVPYLVTSGLETVAVRVPNHPLALELLRGLPFPLAAPSANPFGYISPTRAEHVEVQLGDKIAYILDGGRCTSGIESTIVGFDDDGEPVIFRSGAISLETIREVASSISLKTEHHTVVAPGMLPKHYSPKTPFRISTNVEAELLDLDPLETGVILLQRRKVNLPDSNVQVLSEHGNLQEAASNLYDAMHKLDTGMLKLILAEPAPDHGLGVAINDKLTRAACQ